MAIVTARLALLAALVAPLSAYGCGSSKHHDSGGTDASADDASDDAGVDAGDDSGDGDAGPPGYPAPHPAAPQVVTLGGPVMKTPKIVPVVFSGDPLASQISTFLTQLVATTAYWHGATSEYGVGPLSATPIITLSEAPPTTTTDGDIQTWLGDKITAGAPFPPADGNTIYAIFYPSGTTVTALGGTSCLAFEGYHNGFTMNSGYASYAVMPRCMPGVNGVSLMDQLTSTASHEFIEAATDPEPENDPAYATCDGDHREWEYFGGGEVGDVCAQFGAVFYRPAGIANLVQHTWSDKAAAAGHDPCEPDGAMPYFNSAPVLPDKIAMQLMNGEHVSVTGVKIPLHTSRTIEVDLFSDAPTPKPWKVSGIDIASQYLGQAQALKFTFDKTSGQNGDKLMLTIDALQPGPAVFWLQSQLGTQIEYWIGVVGN